MCACPSFAAERQQCGTVNFYTLCQIPRAACVLSEILMNPVDMQREREREKDARVKC